MRYITLLFVVLDLEEALSLSVEDFVLVADLSALVVSAAFFVSVSFFFVSAALAFVSAFVLVLEVLVCD